MLPKALQDLIDALGTLPGVGSRSAERFAYFLFKNDASRAKLVSQAIENIHEKVKICPVTFALIDAGTDISPLYSDERRDKKTIVVVAEPFDVLAIEKTNMFNGTYHVLGGLVSPIDGITPESLHIDQLVARVKKDNVLEIILATNATVEGESTAYYISKQLETLKVKITRLAQGMPIGLDIEYADQITLGKALEGRRAL